MSAEYVYILHLAILEPAILLQELVTQELLHLCLCCSSNPSLSPTVSWGLDLRGHLSHTHDAGIIHPFLQTSLFLVFIGDANQTNGSQGGAVILNTINECHPLAVLCLYKQWLYKLGGRNSSLSFISQIFNG